MRKPHVILLIFASLAMLSASLNATEPEITSDRLREAIKLAIPTLEEGSRVSANERKCFTCHGQAMPVIALTAAKRQGLEIDQANLERQAKHTFEHLKSGQEKYNQGKGQGGQVLTAGYALWTLAEAEQPAGDVTTAVVTYLLAYQSGKDHWHHRGKRPPTSGSDFTASYVALRGLHDFGSEKLQSKIEERRQQVAKWLLKTKPKDTEDRVFQLRAGKLLQIPAEIVQKQRDELVALQRTDGGWSQNAEIESDAYATGSVLATLLETGVANDSPAIQRGLQYLLDTQQEDGTWHVKTRAVGFQEYYESGFPHAEDQFVSIAASSWATLALVKALPQN